MDYLAPYFPACGDGDLGGGHIVKRGIGERGRGQAVAESHARPSLRLASYLVGLAADDGGEQKDASHHARRDTAEMQSVDGSDPAGRRWWRDGLHKASQTVEVRCLHSGRR